MLTTTSKLNTTLQALTKLVLRFDNKRLEIFYRRLSKESPEFREKYIDRLMGLMIKIERYVKEHKATEAEYLRLTSLKKRAEADYEEWTAQDAKRKSLEELIKTDQDIHNAFTRLMELSTTNKFLGKEGIDALIQAEKVLDLKLTKLHEQQLSLNKQYITDTWHYARRLYRVLRSLIQQIALLEEQFANANFVTFELDVEKIILELNDLFLSSLKPTPTGYHFISLEDFLMIGIKKIVAFLSFDNLMVVRNYTYDVLSDFYHELLSFYGGFHGTDQEIKTTMEARDANAEKLRDTMMKLRELVEAYASRLDGYSKTPEEIKSYEGRVAKTPKPPPTLHR